MKTEQKFILRFDQYTLPMSVDSVKKFIIKELKRLSVETGYSIDSLKIEFYSNAKESTLAYFQSCGSRPIGFFFNLAVCSGRSANQIIDVCRHEFAHFVLFMRKTGHDPKRPHNAAWKKVCKELGAAPYAYASNEITRHIVLGK